MFYSYQIKSLWLSLFLGILFFFDVILNEIIFLLSLSGSSIISV